MEPPTVLSIRPGRPSIGWRRGDGREILRALLSHGREQGAQKAYLVAAESNTAARSLYEQQGLTVSGRYHYRVRRPLPSVVSCG
ncbi:GNAT family N-acetyltransferase [Streptosporangium sp. NPDC087985]|uniref:GNAT family N-acetyltransferase n=1 Tax=Streptosporangium sp. NPDC087985 TaxID=3366196 RepID=UPI003830BE7F